MSRLPKRKTKKNNKKIIINLAVAIIILILCWFFNEHYGLFSELFNSRYHLGQNELAIHFVDVGQGDCVIIQFPDSKNMIIDGGPVSAKQHLLDYINNKLGISEFDYLMLTHTDSDHCGSLTDVINNTVIKKMFLPDVSADLIDTATYKAFIAAVENEKLPQDSVVISKTGTQITGENYEIVFFTPSTEMYKDVTKNNTNFISPVIILYYCGRSAVFTGDATEETEKYFLEVAESVFRDKDVDADILKVAHHGSRYSSTAAFLDAVRPEFSVISVGNNTYGHPHLDTLERLAGYSHTILRTDKSGDIRISLIDDGTGGARIEIDIEKGQTQNSLQLRCLSVYMIYIISKHLYIVFAV
jgi:competence protein ComEC